MRTLLLVCGLAAFAAPTHAAIMTYDIDANFSRVLSPSGIVRATPGGRLMGFIEIDTAQADDAAILDYELTSFLPQTFDNPFRTVDYRFSDIGNSDAGENRDGFSFATATGALNLASDVLTTAFNNVAASTTSILNLNLGTLGADVVPLTGGERYLNCVSGFNFSGFFNVCDRFLATNADLSGVLTVRDAGGDQGGGGQGGGNGPTPVSSPATLALLLSGLVPLALKRRRIQ